LTKSEMEDGVQEALQ